MLKIAYYELKKISRDHRWLAIFIAQPIIIILLLGLVARHDPTSIKVAVFNSHPNQYSDQLVQDIRDNQDLKIITANTSADLHSQIDKDKVRAAVVIDVQLSNNFISGQINIIQNATSPDLSAKAQELILSATQNTLKDFTVQNTQAAFQSALGPTADQINSNNVQINPTSIIINQTKNSVKPIKYFDFFASAVIVILIILVGLHTSSTTITQERIDGTFERFFVTPFTKTQMIVGKMLAYSLISLLLAIVTIATLTLFYKVTLGPLWLVLLTTFLTGLTAVSLGMLISSFTYTIAESIQVSNLIFFSCLLLTTFIFQPESMHPAIATVTKFVPFTYSVRAMREINLLSMNFTDIRLDLLILTGSLICFVILSILFLHRKVK